MIYRRLPTFSRLVLAIVAFVSAILISTRIVHADALSCSSGNVFATVDVDVGGFLTEYRLSGTGPGIPTAGITGIGHFTASWTLPGPGNWDVTLEWRDGGTNDPWNFSAFNSHLQLSCVSGGSDAIGKAETKSIPQCANLFDGRINNQPSQDCAAPVAIYPGSIDVYGIDPLNGQGTFALRVTDDQIEAVGIPTGANVLLGQAINPSSGQLILLHRLTTGEFQVNAWYPDGKPYIFVWGDNGNKYHLADQNL